ncbi:hypothetical protein NDU88_010642 [Pleurodeles waltl]|uniref:Uncharacterized protein n=1 Tax=Pleurodeles waltl TaxID=8319 RepID=A0AAV7QUZ4_PLEWA|nr:hypothetical protein NDU88_010642 [Pleurodeles waltl]
MVRCPRALLRQPRSVPDGRGWYAARQAASARGRFLPLRGLVPGSAPLPNGGRHSRALDFEVSESGGLQDTPRVPNGTNRIVYDSGFGQMTEGSGALLECDRHLDARGHARE